jgi:GalNAc-alpha-(1->4)-GalNAc-alpha-(1->3)-diNAcBac-PP-undecaprenol alpha-1,4-N-acetyl-D-galactosaminyltransferase
VLSFGEYWNNLVLLSTLGLKLPVFVSDRSQPDKSLGRFQDKLKKWLYPRAAGVILQTEKAREIYLRKHRSRNIAVIGNPVRDIGKGKEGIKREKSVLMVGRLIKSKNQDKLIEIFAKVLQPGWKLLLVGYDHLKQNNLERLQKLARELQIEEKVIFTGKQDQIENIYLSSSVFAFTSSSEGFPNVIGEAMSAGLPVVAYDCTAGPSDIIRDGENGFLVPLFDSTIFESKLALLMADKKLRAKMGATARESIKHFSSERICESFYQFIMNDHLSSEK